MNKPMTAEEKAKTVYPDMASDDTQAMMEDLRDAFIAGFNYHQQFKDDLRELIKDSFGISMNANDLFEYSCADKVLIDAEDLTWVLPIFAKHRWSGVDACMAYIARKMPIKPHVTKEFEEAYAEIKKSTLKFIRSIERGKQIFE